VAEQDCRERLIDATLNLSCRCGYEATTTDQIAGAAGVPPSEFVRYFPTKDAVILAIVDDLVQATAAALRHVDVAAQKTGVESP
jgi:AcrR family transcriptional regulator